jgi:hypothetical protein
LLYYPAAPPAVLEVSCTKSTQIQDGVTGYLVSSAAECARRCVEVLADPEKHRQMALAGKEYVRHEFLTPRLLRDDLRLFSDLRAGKIGRRA